MIGPQFTILLRATYGGIAEVNPFVRIWLNTVAPPIQNTPPNKKPEEK